MKGMVSKTKELNETKLKNQNKTNFNILYIYVRGFSFIRACKRDWDMRLELGRGGMV
jgi:hypothetical protein